MRRDGFTAVKGSDHIDGVRYDSMERKLYIKFQNGSVYAAHGVLPQAHQEFMDAPSQGEHYHRFIKDQYHIERVS